MPTKRIVIDLGQRFKNAFGFVAARQSSNLKKAGFSEKAGISNVDVFVRNNISFEDFSLSGNGFDLQFGFTEFNKKGSEGKIFAPPPMISWDKEKNMEETDINGVDAQVAENYGHRAWDISIQGLLIDMENHNYPSGKVKEMRLLFDTDAPFKVAGQIWDDLGIKSIYFKKFSIAGVQGYEDTMQFTLMAKSIKPAEFFQANRYN